ncbi:hypothetical protein AHF37_04210 [Paragonimus kellicotti]|nr:hypothetical protein AHF37_04210 [Paragonimus kellicotti]
MHLTSRRLARHYGFKLQESIRFYHRILPVSFERHWVDDHPARCVDRAMEDFQFFVTGCIRKQTGIPVWFGQYVGASPWL